MSSTGEAVDSVSVANADARRKSFFVVCAAILVVIMAVGFAPSFYAPGLLKSEAELAKRTPLPGYIVAHGVLLTLWFLGLFAQALLVNVRRVDLHRKVGVAGACLALAVFGLSFFVNLRSAPHLAATGMSISRVALPVIGNFGVLLLFGMLVTAAIALRKKPDFHKRYLLIASVGMIAPAIARWPGAEETLPLSVVLPQIAFLVALFVFDRRRLGRFHKATILGTVAYLVVMGVSVPLALSDLGAKIVDGLM